MIFHGLPRLHVMNNLARELNSSVNVFSTPNTTVGKVSLRARVVATVERLLATATPYQDSLLAKKRIRIKLTGDGTNLGRSLHMVYVAFCIVDEKKAATVRVKKTFPISFNTVPFRFTESGTATVRTETPFAVSVSSRPIMYNTRARAHTRSAAT